MTKPILITGATDGIGLLTAQTLVAQGHKVLLHGRSAEKLRDVQGDMGGDTLTSQADLSSLAEVSAFADDVKAQVQGIDVLINNAGVLKAAKPVLDTGQSSD